MTRIIHQEEDTKMHKFKKSCDTTEKRFISVASVLSDTTTQIINSQKEINDAHKDLYKTSAKYLSRDYGLMCIHYILAWLEDELGFDHADIMKKLEMWDEEK